MEFNINLDQDAKSHFYTGRIHGYLDAPRRTESGNRITEMYVIDNNSCKRRDDNDARLRQCIPSDHAVYSIIMAAWCINKWIAEIRRFEAFSFTRECYSFPRRHSNALMIDDVHVWSLPIWHDRGYSYGFTAFSAIMCKNIIWQSISGDIMWKLLRQGV